MANVIARLVVSVVQLKSARFSFIMSWAIISVRFIYEPARTSSLTWMSKYLSLKQSLHLCVLDELISELICCWIDVIYEIASIIIFLVLN